MKEIINELGDFLAISIGVIGALLKGLKNKLKPVTIVLACAVAGVLSYSILGVVEIFYHELSPKLVILVSFITGWVANEVTAKLDLLVNDVYEIFIEWVRNKFKISKDEESPNNDSSGN
jgi:hypothetical protein